MNMQAINTALNKVIKRKVAHYKIVYRLEHKIDCVGPFQFERFKNQEIYNQFVELTHEDTWLANHPTPECEGVSFLIVMECIHGCKNMEQLKDWFGDFLEYFVNEENFHVVKYYVRLDGVYYTKCQAIFEPEQVIKKVEVKLK